MYREKINEFIRIISESDDADCLDLMEELISSASDYIGRVNALEIGLMVGKYTKEGAEYREYVEKLDRQRSNAHNVLISNVKTINRLCRKNNLPLIFQGNEEERIEIAEFAQKVVDELFNSRRL